MKSFFRKGKIREWQPRRTLYIQSIIDEDLFVCSGIEFREFCNCFDLKMLLLMRGHFHISENSVYRFTFVDENYMELLKSEDIHNYGDFAFVDLEDSKGYKNIPKQELAEIIYMQHMYEPFEKPFFPSTNNKFVYLAHDDGWYAKIYFREHTDFIKLLKYKISSVVPNIHLNCSDDELFALTEKGLLIEILDDKLDAFRIDLDHHICDVDKILNNEDKIEIEENRVLLY